MHKNLEFSMTGENTRSIIFVNIPEQLSSIIKSNEIVSEHVRNK